jgi:twinkle protein
MSNVINREQCPACARHGRDNSQDNLAVYDDGHKYCYACEHYENGKIDKKELPMVQSKPMRELQLLNGTAKAINNRKIGVKTARLYGYLTHSNDGKKIEISNYYRDGKVVAQKLRGANKSFQWRGDASSPALFGQQLWKNKGGKRVIVTEGEYDCLTVSQLLDNKWAVVSLPNGAAGAVKSARDNLEFLSSYDEIVLMFDMDDAGREASQKVAEILPPGKCKIASLPYKDANECMLNGESQAVIKAMWEAPRYSPDEILHVSTIANEMEDDVDAEVYPFPFDSLSDFLLGQRSGEITLWTSGTGSGKSTILREILINHLREGRSVGAIMLEESPKETVDDLISLIINKPVRAIRASKIMNELRVKLGKSPLSINIIDDLTDEEYAKGKRTLSDTSLYIYDHLGNNGLQNLCSRIEFMAVSLGVDVIMLDHITAAATGLLGGGSDYDGGSSERLLIDNIMKELRALVSRTGVHIDVVSQLKKTQKAYEEGDRITLQDLRGSGSLSSVPNTVIALERDRQNPDAVLANCTTVRVLKNRLTGKAGVASCLYYDHSTGRMNEIDWTLGDDGDIMVSKDIV